MDGESEYMFRFGHFRVPDPKRTHSPSGVLIGGLPSRGSPSPLDMIPYGRSQGWLPGEVPGAIVADQQTVMDKFAANAMNADPKVLPFERGGMTICDIVDEDDTVIAQGIAVCSYSDNFNYRMGRTIAQGRALAELEELENE